MTAGALGDLPQSFPGPPISASGRRPAGLPSLGHYNGTNWTKMAIAGSTGSISSIYAAAANDVWFSDMSGAVFRWNGNAFRKQDSGISNTGFQTYLWGSDPKNVWFAGRGLQSYRK